MATLALIGSMIFGGIMKTVSVKQGLKTVHENFSFSTENGKLFMINNKTGMKVQIKTEE